ncbi:hypothetical protein WKW80_05210 [Variovorax humicola]|uniref:Uncharacterized protein n=1 Tax=Variovorax humicola TaxID=1769758 RepID=A0ABU8VWQ0_9BURK
MSPETARRIEQRVHAAVKANRLRIVPLGEAGAVRIVGPGVDLTAATITDVLVSDLQPHFGEDLAPREA